MTSRQQVVLDHLDRISKFLDMHLPERARKSRARRRALASRPGHPTLPRGTTVLAKDRIKRSVAWLRSAARTFALAIVTPLLEKNAMKTVTPRSIEVPLVFSMTRVIVLAFAIAMLHQAWRAGIAGWPEATLSIAIVLALPILGAMERARPADMIDVAKSLVNRFGNGQTRTGVADVFGREPSMRDDHTSDEGAP